MGLLRKQPEVRSPTVQRHVASVGVSCRFFLHIPFSDVQHGKNMKKIWKVWSTQSRQQMTTVDYHPLHTKMWGKVFAVEMITRHCQVLMGLLRKQPKVRSPTAQRHVAGVGVSGCFTGCLMMFHDVFVFLLLSFFEIYLWHFEIYPTFWCIKWKKGSIPCLKHCLLKQIEDVSISYTKIWVKYFLLNLLHGIAALCSSTCDHKPWLFLSLPQARRKNQGCPSVMQDALQMVMLRQCWGHF